MQSIGIREVLAEIEVNLAYEAQKTFSIVFVKSDGSLGSIEKARKKTKNAQASRPSPGSGFKYNLKERQTLLLEDTKRQSDNIRAIKIPMIIKFNGRPVYH